MSRGDQPAYPVHPDTDYAQGEHGMTIREEFAARAMQGLLARPGSDLDQDQIAADSWLYADALLAALEQGEKA